LMSRVADLPVGSQTTLNIDRDGKKMDMKLTILDRMEVFKDDPRVVGEVSVPDDAGKPAEATQARFGISIRPASDQERELTPEKHGVAVTRVEPGSFAEDIGMLERDVIVSINRQPVSSVDDIRRIQQTLKPGDPVAFRVVRSAPTQLRGRGVPASQSIFLSGTLPQN
jgi:serine protease Do